MIKIDKFKALKPSTALKKATVIISSKIHDGKSVLDDYSREVYKHLYSIGVVDPSIMDELIERVEGGENPLLIAEYLKGLSGLGDVNWDYIKGSSSGKTRIVKERYLVLDNIRSPYNIGAIFRSAESFMIKKIYIIGSSSALAHPRALRTSSGTIESIEGEVITELDALELFKNNPNLHVFSLECGGENINSFRFPDEGICIIGNEEFGVNTRLKEASRSIVTIPQFGLKGSINVSVATGIMLNLWCQF